MYRKIVSTIFFLTILFILPLSAADFNLKGISMYGGIVLPENWDAGFNAGAGVSLGELSPGTYLFPGLTFWETTSEQTDGADVDLSDFSIAVDVHYFIKHAQQGLYVGGGLSYNIMSWEYSYLSYPSGSRYWINYNDEKIGFAPVAGYVFNPGSIAGFAEFKYNLLEDFNTVQISVGLVFGKK